MREQTMAFRGLHDRTVPTGMPQGVGLAPRLRRRRQGLAAPALRFRSRALSLAAALVALLIQPCWPAANTVGIAVFDFELNDASAGGGIIGRDAIDIENLRESTEEARRLLSASGRYRIIDTSGVAAEVVSAGGIQHCNACDGPLARKMGADRSMIGVITRVNRTEYTLQILVRDAHTGAVISNDFTGLRMGANYAWPRGVRSLMNNRILAAQNAQ
jgi:hypothetical protein